MIIAHREYAARFTALILRTFFFAYYAHANGASEDELLIDYEITAAGNDQDKEIIDSCCKTIRAACAAVDDDIPFEIAHNHLSQHLNERIDELLASH